MQSQLLGQCRAQLIVIVSDQDLAYLRHIGPCGSGTTQKGRAVVVETVEWGGLSVKKRGRVPVFMKQKITIPAFTPKTVQFLRVSRCFTKPWTGRLSVGGGLVIPCSLGRNGATRFKREGDGKTPLGSFALKPGYVQRERFRALPATRLTLRQLTGSEGWCDDVNSPTYNRPIRLPNPAGHEILKRSDGVYDLVLVLDYNLCPRIKGRGSAIFFHLTRERGEPTAGCIAIAKDDMRRLLPRLGKKTRLLIV